MATLSPWLDQKFYLADGITPNAGGKVFTYEPGTTTKKFSYVSESGAANTNPIILNSAGECNLWLGSGGYKIVNAPSTDTDPPTSAIKTWDDINIDNSSGEGAGVVDSIAQLKGLDEGAFETVQVLGYHSANGVGGGLYYWNASSTSADNLGTIIAPTVTDGTGRWILQESEVTRVSQFGARGASSVEDVAAISAASTYATARGRTLVIDSPVLMNSNLSIDSYIKSELGGYFTSTNASTLTLSGRADIGLVRFFYGDVVFSPGLGVVSSISPIWWGADQNGVGDSTAAFQAAIEASKPSKIPIRTGAGLFIITDTLEFDANQIQLFGAGPQNTQLWFSEASKACIKVAVTLSATPPNPLIEREYWSIQDIGFSCTGSPASCIAIDAQSAPTGVIRNVWATNYAIALRHGLSYNLTVDSARLIACRQYGIFADENANDTCYVNCVVTCDNSVGSRCMKLESNHGVSIQGGAFEDAEWGIELDSGEYTFDGYVESLIEGPFLIVGNGTLLNILNCYSFNNGATAFVKSTAGDVDVIVNHLRIVTTGGTVNPAFLFDMAGFASVAYGRVIADNALWEPGGAQFADMTAGYLQRFTTPYRITHHSPTENISEVTGSTLGYAQKLSNVAGNGGLNIVAGNNKVNDGSENLLMLEAGDGTDVLQVQSGGQVELTGTLSATSHLSTTGRLKTKRGVDVASANDLTLGQDGSSFGITGTTNINGIATSGWPSGTPVKLFLLGAITVKHNTAPSGGFAKFALQGAADFVGASGAILTVEYDGTVWQETARRTA